MADPLSTLKFWTDTLKSNGLCCGCDSGDGKFVFPSGETIDSTRWLKLAAYVARIHARPSFKSLIEEETPFVQRFRDAA